MSNAEVTSEAVSRQMALWCGVTPLVTNFAPSVEEMVPHTDRYLLEQGLLRKGDVVVLARWSPLRAIVVFTRSGYSAYLVSKERPRIPIFAFTPSEAVSRQMALWCGVTPLVTNFAPSVEEMVPHTDRYLLEQGLLRKGDVVVLARWSPLRAKVWTNFIQLHRLATKSADARLATD